MSELPMDLNRAVKQPAPPPPRCLMIGGFLGSGKTTSVARLADWLIGREIRVGLIVNDQGSHLVDREVLAERGFPVQEVPGGCFCCRFDALVGLVRRMTAEHRPEVFVAEPVGSCADLAATVTYPLLELYREGLSIGPLSVLVDPTRALRIFGLKDGGRFSDEIAYIYLKQLEEADVIVINKCDTVAPDDLERLRRRLSGEFPDARIFAVSALQAAAWEAVEHWAAVGNLLSIDWERIESFSPGRPQPTHRWDKPRPA